VGDPGGARLGRGEPDRMVLKSCPVVLAVFGGWGCGVWLFFENSTGCLICQCQVLFVLASLYVGTLFNRFLLESLILAQDERWRRA
jgi:hypothetical protein